MRQLTTDELSLLGRRRSNFDEFYQELMPVLTDFMERLDLPSPELVLIEADKFMPALDSWIKSQNIDENDRVWIITRIGYFIGEYLVQRHGGSWFLCEIPDARFFGRYVVGRFVRAKNRNAMVEPFGVADALLAQPLGRSLSAFLAQVDDEIDMA